MTLAVEVPRRQTVSDHAEELLPSAGRTRAAAQRRYLTSVTPWQTGDVGRSLVLGAAGLVALGACWYGASYETDLRAQVGWILGSLLSVAVFVLAAVLWLLAGLREVRRGVRELDVDKRSVFGLAEKGTVGSAVHDADEFVSGTGMTLAHRRTCLLVRGKQVDVVAGPELLALRACDVCRALGTTAGAAS